MLRCSMTNNRLSVKWGDFVQLNIEESNRFIDFLTDRTGVLEYPLAGSYFNVIMFKVFTPKTYLKLEHKYLKEAKKKMDNLIANTSDLIQVQWSKGEFLFVLVSESTDRLNDLQEKFIYQILTIMNTYPCLRYFGGIGKVAACNQELPLSFHEANKAYIYQFIWESSAILEYSRIPEDNLEKYEEANKRLHEISTFDKKKIESFLKDGRIYEVNIFVVEYLKSIGRTNMDSFLFRQYIVLDTYFIVSSFIEELGYDRELIEKPLGENAKMMLSLMSFDFMKQYLICIFTKGINLRDKYDSIYKI